MDDGTYMRMALEEAAKSQSKRIYRVGAVIVQQGRVVARAHNNDDEEPNHAEARAIRMAADLKGATIYSTVEPCGGRKTGKPSCSDEIILAGIGRVVFGAADTWRAEGYQGRPVLEKAGIAVQHLREFEDECRRVSFNPEHQAQIQPSLPERR